MTCLSPRTVGFKSDGKTICWSQTQYSKEFATFQLPCGKCLPCRLEYARQWAVRCVHEAQMHEENCFITLTYDDAHLISPKLIYKHFQDFMKRLRKTKPDAQIGVFVTGEYGEKRKRPHWHALIFNWRPSDPEYKYTSDRGDIVFSSKSLSKLWPSGAAEFGDVTFNSAGYCARYAAKKLGHGKDGTHGLEPISKKSSKHAIGKRWLEKYWPDAFNHGRIILPDGASCAIPRYYEKWLQKNEPEAFVRYVTQTKNEKIQKAQNKEAKEKDKETKINLLRSAARRGLQIKRNVVKKKIIEQKFKQLQERLKL